MACLRSSSDTTLSKIIVIGTSLPADRGFPVPPLPDSLEFVLLRAFLCGAGSINIDFAFGSFD